MEADEERLVEDLIDKTGKYVLRSETLKEEQLKIIQKHGPESPNFRETLHCVGGGEADGVVEENRGTMDMTGDMIAQFHDKFSRHVTKITAEDEMEVVISPFSLPSRSHSYLSP